MGNHQICLIGGQRKPSEEEEKDRVDYIASYKPGRKLLFHNFYYKEENLLLKLDKNKNKSQTLDNQLLKSKSLQVLDIGKELKTDESDIKSNNILLK